MGLYTNNSWWFGIIRHWGFDGFWAKKLVQTIEIINCLVVSNMFFFPSYIGNVIIPTDELIFLEGWLTHQPVKNIQQPPWFKGHVSENAGFSEI